MNIKNVYVRNLINEMVNSGDSLYVAQVKAKTFYRADLISYDEMVFVQEVATKIEMLTENE